MKLIVGLGNPGPEYEGTRHNIGFRIVDAFASRFRIPLSQHEKNARTGKGRVAGQAVMLARPLTFMNLSGEAVRGLLGAYLESPADLMVVYDDIDLPVGRIRIKPSGSAGTHNGMRSIISEIKSENFARLRVGILGERAGEPLRDYVLDAFHETEAAKVEEAVTRSVDALVLFVRDEIRRAMNEFNRDTTLVQPKEAS